LRLLQFIAYGIAFALVPEFTNLVIINKMPSGFAGAMVVYCILLSSGYGVQKLIDRRFRGAVFPNVLCIIFFGLFGLSFEWVVVGNSPWKNPDAIQWGMFVYWAGLYMIPRMLVDDREAVKSLAQRIKRIYIIYSAVHLLIALTLPTHVLIFVVPVIWTIMYTCFGGFYLKYIRLLKNQEVTIHGAEQVAEGDAVNRAP